MVAVLVQAVLTPAVEADLLALFSLLSAGWGVGRPQPVVPGHHGSRSVPAPEIVHAYLRGSKPWLPSASGKIGARSSGCQQYYWRVELFDADL